MIRYILLTAVLPFLIVGVLAQGGQLRHKGALADTSPANWPSSNRQYMQTTAPPHVADLLVSKTASPDPAMEGSPLTYTITITNDGPADATGVILADALPLTVDFGSVQASQGSCSQTIFVVTCNLNNLTTFATATVTIVVTPTQAATIINTVAVANSAPEDPNTQNNVATTTTLVRPSPQTNPIYLPVILK